MLNNNESIGRKKILIPIHENNLNADNIKKILPEILRAHSENVRAYNYWHEYYLGKQPILNKSRDKSVSDNNSKIVINHAKERVDFKTGFMFGTPVRYVNKTNPNDDTDDITREIAYLNSYMKELEADTINKNVAVDFFNNGVGYKICLPTENDSFTRSPFTIYKGDPRLMFVAYTNDYRQKKALGGVITLLPNDDLNSKRDKYELNIYTNTNEYVFEVSVSTLHGFFSVGINDITLLSESEDLRIIPIVEYPLNEDRYGITEYVHLIDNAINEISSNTVDDIKDFVNKLLVLYNVNFNEETAETFKKHKVIELQQPSPDKMPKAEYLSASMDYKGVQSLIEYLTQLSYDLAGVPPASSNVSSGGDTQGARLLGNGWTRALQNINNDCLSFSRAERETLNICLYFAKRYGDNPISNLESADIDIIFNIDKSDNLAVKIQSLRMLYDMNVPKAISLDIVGVSSDNQLIADQWGLYEKEKLRINEPLKNEPPSKNEQPIVNEKEYKL